MERDPILEDRSENSIVALEDDLLAVPAKLFLEQFAVGIDHLVQSADVGLHVAALTNNLANVVLNVASKSWPIVATAAQSRQVVEVGMRLFDGAKLIAVVEAVFVASAIHQPEFAILMPLGTIEKPMHHAAKGSDSRSCGDENRILVRLPQGEHAVGSVKLNGCAFFEIAQPVRQKPVFDAVEAEVERRRSPRMRRKRVGAGMGFAIRLRLLNRDELSGSKCETARALNGELQVLGLV